MATGTPHQTPGPETWEQIAWHIHDRLERERRRGKAAAEQLARQALQAIEPLQQESQPMNDDIKTFLRQPAEPPARKPAQPSAAQIAAETAKLAAETAKLRQNMAEQQKRTAQLLSAVEPPTALATLDRLAAERAKQSGATREQAFAEVLGEQPDLYSQYRAELAAERAKQATEPPAAPRPPRPAADLLDQLARERAASEGLDYADALQAVAAERPSLYAAYRKEGLKR